MLGQEIQIMNTGIDLMGGVNSLDDDGNSNKNDNDNLNGTCSCGCNCSCGGIFDYLLDLLKTIIPFV